MLHAATSAGGLDIDFLSVATAARLIGLAWWYLNGWQALAARSRKTERWRPGSFVASCAAAGCVLLPPFDALADKSFAAHMAQHLVLVFVVAPLAALSEPLLPLIRALPRPWRRAAAPALRFGIRLQRGLEHPVTALAVFTFALWTWHVPAMFNLAERQPIVHFLEHATFLLAGMAFVLPLIRSKSSLWFLPYLFATAMQGTILGALLTFSSEPWYAGTGGLAEMSPVTDQQIGGALMCLAGGVATLGFGSWAFLRWAAAQPATPRRRVPPGEEFAR